MDLNEIPGESEFNIIKKILKKRLTLIEKFCILGGAVDFFIIDDNF
jgi:hypothetical protein